MAKSAQKFIARNRAPRVQIEYDVELYGAEKKVQLPFVMGVMSDLAGKSEVDQGSVASRKFLEIDVDNFDERMKSIAPRAAFNVPNTLTGEGNMSIDLTFNKMSDFEPAAIAAKTDALRPLLEARRQLTDLMTYMDGKAGAEALIEKVLKDPALLGALAAGSADRSAEQAAALDALRAADVAGDTPVDTSDATLDALRQADVPAAPTADDGQSALDALRAAAPEEAAPSDTSASALDALRDAAPAEQTPEETIDPLAALRAAPVEEATEEDGQDAALDALKSSATPDAPEADDGTSTLDALRAAELPETEDDDSAESILAGLDAPVDVATEDSADDVLATLESTASEPEPAPAGDTVAATLAGLDAPDAPPAEADTDDILGGLEAVETSDDETSADDILADLEAIEEPPAPEDVDDLGALLADLPPAETAPPEDGIEDALASLDAPVAPQAEETSADDILAELDTPTVSQEDVADDLDALLDGIETPAAEADEPSAQDVLSTLDAPESTEQDDDDLDALLAGIDAPEEGQDAATAEDVLSSLEPAEVSEAAEDDLDALLADIEAPVETEDTSTDDVLGSIEAIEEGRAEEDDLDALLSDIHAPADPEPEESDDLDALLADIDTREDAENSEDVDDILADLEPAALDQEEGEESLDALLSDLETSPAAPEDEADDLDALLADLEAEDVGTEDAKTNVDDILGDLDTGDDTAAAADDVDDILADLEPAALDEDTNDDDLDALLADLEDDASDTAEEDDLDSLLADLDSEDTVSAAPDTPADDLDALLADLDDEPPAAAEDDLDALLADLDAPTGDTDAPVDDLDAALAELDAAPEAEEAPATKPESPVESTPRTDEPALAYGHISADRLSPEQLNRKRFRIAILGDFTGRAARGAIEVGDALANREPVLLDVDTVEDVIEGFATTLMLPIGKDGAAVEVKLGGLEDLHPDELYENVELFSALKDLKTQLSHGGTAEGAAQSLKAWGEAHGQKVTPAKTVSGGNTVRADLKLSDFQKLIGDTGGQLTQASPVEELLARVVGPHIRKLPDPNVTAMAEAVDDALSAAMRLVLHHPEFQSVEAQWRSIDLIARSIETDDTLDVMLYDISAEEIAADLTQSDDLAESGFVRLLTEAPLDEENGRGAYSAMIGMYSFEETPPHAQLLGRIARVAAHVDAPFIAAMTPGFLETAKEDRHPLVASEWDRLRAMPEAGHLALASPRFLLRRPYGAKTEPIYEFEFEEFTESDGLSGMLWANPVSLVSILLAKSFRENGASMGLGKIMSLGGMPYHYVNDRYGDQVALPCTERNLTLDKVEIVMGRGYLPVIAIKGRDEIRLGAFQSLAGGDILGPWAKVPPPPPSPPEPPQAAPQEGAAPAEETSDQDDLDALLSSFDLDAAGDDDQSEDDMDAELAALLADL